MSFVPAGAFMGQPQMQFNPQGFSPAMGGGVSTTNVIGGGPVMPGMTLPNGGYIGMQQPGGMSPSQGMNMYNMQQGQQQQVGK